MCTPIGTYKGDAEKLQTKKATKFVQELIFNAIMGVSLVALIFGFVILIKVLIGQVKAVKYPHYYKEMTKKYSEMRNYILSCRDHESLDEAASTTYNAYRIGMLKDEEYANLRKLMNCIVKKGVECINS